MSLRQNRYHLAEAHDAVSRYQPSCIRMVMVSSVPRVAAHVLRVWAGRLIDGCLVGCEHLVSLTTDTISARFNLLSSVVVGITAITVLLAPGVTAAMAGFALAFANTISHDLLFVVSSLCSKRRNLTSAFRSDGSSSLSKVWSPWNGSRSTISVHPAFR